MMKSFFKRLLRKAGLELHRFSVEASGNSRFIKMLKHHNVNLIFDVGANTGQFGLLLRDSGFKGGIISFEPLSDARKKLLKTSYKDPLWQIAPQAAIGEKNGEIEIQIAGNSQSSSILNMLSAHINAAPESKYVGKEKVALRQLDSITPQYMNSNSIVFLKIDTQGYEENVLKGAKKLIPQVIGLQVEISLVPLYEGQCLFDEMLKNIKKHGFEIWGISTVLSDPITAQILQVDVTFFRSKNYNTRECIFEN